MSSPSQGHASSQDTSEQRQTTSNKPSGNKVHVSASKKSTPSLRPSSSKLFSIPLKVELPDNIYDIQCNSPYRNRNIEESASAMLQPPSPLHQALLIASPPVLSTTTQSATSIRLSLVTPTTIPICQSTTITSDVTMTDDESTDPLCSADKTMRRRRSLSTPSNELTNLNLSTTPRRSISTNVIFHLSPNIIVHIDHLPNSLLERIFHYLSYEDLWCNARLVCRRWREVATNPIFWRHLDLKKQTSLEWALQRAKERPLLLQLYARAWKYASLGGITLLLPYFPMLECIDMGFCDLSMEREPGIVVALAEHGSRNDSSEDNDLESTRKKSLRHVNLEGNDNITGEMISILTRFQSNITVLNLSHCTQLDDATIITVANNLHQLHRLNVDGVQWIHDSSIIYLTNKHYLWLEGLWVDGCELTDVGIQALAVCSRLKYFSISFCDGLTDVALHAIREIASLTNLTFRKAPLVTQNGFLELFRPGYSRLSNLRVLDVNECPRFDDAAIEAMCTICGPSIQFLSLNWCWNVTDVGIRSMVDHLSNLNVLSLVGIHQIYGVPFQDVPHKMAYLCVLNLDHCNRIEDERMLHLARAMPSLWIVNYYGVRFGDDNNLMIDTKHYFEKSPLCDHSICDSAF